MPSISVGRPSKDEGEELIAPASAGAAALPAATVDDDDDDDGDEDDVSGYTAAYA